MVIHKGYSKENARKEPLFKKGTEDPISSLFKVPRFEEFLSHGES
jgi:hypothetical protein